MPGQTNNQTILAAENQQVDALNDIEQAIINLSNPTVTVDLSGLTLAISTLGATLASALENLSMNINQTVNCGCCGSSGGSTTTQPGTSVPDPGSGQPGGNGPGDPPSNGQSTPTGTTQQIDERRCKVAILMIDNYLGGVAEYGDTYNVDVFINTIVAAGGTYVAETIGTIAGAAISAALSQVLTPGPGPDDLFQIALGAAIGGVIGHLVATNGSISFSELSDFVQTNREKLICALYNSSNGFSAHSALMSTIDNTSPGLDPGNRAFVDRMFPSYLMALLFFIDNRYQVLEGALSKIDTPCPCAETDPITTTPTDDYKCKAANYIFDSFTDTLTNFGGFSTMSWYSVATFISSLGSGLLSSSFTGIFGLIWGALTATIPQLISYLGTLYWRGTGYFTPLQLVAAEFEANKEAIICELYAAETVAAAREALAVHITDYVGSVMTANPQYQDAQQEYIDTITALLPNAVLNELFKTGAEERPEIASYAPVDYYDCSCGNARVIVFTGPETTQEMPVFDNLTINSYTNGEWPIGSGNTLHQVQFYLPDGERLFDLASLGKTNHPSVQDWVLYHRIDGIFDQGDFYYISDVEPVWSACAGGITIISGTAFSVTVTDHGACQS